MEFYRAKGSRKRRFRRLFRFVARSRRCFIEIPMSNNGGKKSDGRTMIWRDGRTDSRQAHRSLLLPRDDEEKKSQTS